MDYSQKYKEKLVSAEKAASVIKSGDWVDYGWCVGTNVAVDKALASRMPELHDVKIRGGILCHEPEIFKIENPAEHFTWNSWHMNPVERHNVNNGFVFMTPLRYSELPRLYRDMKDPLNVAICQVSPMDAHGYFNFGPCTSHMQAVVDKADVVIVEVNKNMPVCLGGTGAYIHIDQVDMVVEGENPAIDEIPAGGPASDIDKAVAELVVPEIPNGACLQLGIGGMPNAIGQMIAQSDLKDLGIHTEMYVDAFVDMANAGKITGRRKNIDQGRQTYAFGAGTKKLYDYLDTTRMSRAPRWIMSNCMESRVCHRQLYFYQQCGGHRSLRSGQRGECRNQEYLRCRRSAGFRSRSLPLQRWKELHLSVLNLHEQEDRQTGEQNQSDPSTGSIDGHPCERHVHRHRVRYGKPQGTYHVAESRVPDQHRSSGVPRRTDRRGREDEHLETVK